MCLRRIIASTVIHFRIQLSTFSHFQQLSSVLLLRPQTNDVSPAQKYPLRAKISYPRVRHLSPEKFVTSLVASSILCNLKLVTNITFFPYVLHRIVFVSKLSKQGAATVTLFLWCFLAFFLRAKKILVERAGTLFQPTGLCHFPMIKQFFPLLPLDHTHIHVVFPVPSWRRRLANPIW